MTWLVVCLVHSDREFVSLSEVQLKSYSTPIKLSSESTSEFLLAPVGQDNIDYYEIYHSCNLDVTSTNVGEIITYTMLYQDTKRKPNCGLATKHGKWWTHQIYTLFDNRGKQGFHAGRCFNRSKLTNDNVKLKLSYFLDVMPKDPLSPWSWYRWSYNII